jgi:hypothetical protein
MKAEEAYGLNGFVYVGGGKYEAAPGAIIQQPPPTVSARDIVLGAHTDTFYIAVRRHFLASLGSRDCRSPRRCTSNSDLIWTFEPLTDCYACRVK